VEITKNNVLNWHLVPKSISFYILLSLIIITYYYFHFLYSSEKSLSLEKTINKLDGDSLKYLENFYPEPFQGPEPKNMGEMLASIPNKNAISNLLQLGILRSDNRDNKPIYYFTEFAKEVKNKLIKK
jgi:hypothetical protein